MKKSYIFLLTLILSMISFSGCVENEFLKEQLIGKWESLEIRDMLEGQTTPSAWTGVTMEFSSNGKYTGTEDAVTEEGTFVVTAQKVIIVLGDGETETFTVGFEGTNLTLTTGDSNDGVVYVLKKI